MIPFSQCAPRVRVPVERRVGKQARDHSNLLHASLQKKRNSESNARALQSRLRRVGITRCAEKPQATLQYHTQRAFIKPSQQRHPFRLPPRITRRPHGLVCNAYWTDGVRGKKSAQDSPLFTKPNQNLSNEDLVRTKIWRMTSTPPPPSTPAPKLLDRMRQAVRVRGYSLRTEESHTDSRHGAARKPDAASATAKRTKAAMRPLCFYLPASAFQA